MSLCVYTWNYEFWDKKRKNQYILMEDLNCVGKETWLYKEHVMSIIPDERDVCPH